MSSSKSIHPGILFYFDGLQSSKQSLFEELFQLFQELIMMTGGNVSEAMKWLNELDRKYLLTNSDYGMGDFIEELMRQGYLKREHIDNPLRTTKKLDARIRHSAFTQLFSNIRKAKSGSHNTKIQGLGQETFSSLRPYEFGDLASSVDATESLRNAFIHHGIDRFNLQEDDLVVQDSFQQSNCSTVLMIDISHSMILYGEDRITPAKKVALALSQLIQKNYPKDSLDFIVFGDDAWQIKQEQLPYLEVGPYHTNTIAGLELAIKVLEKRKNPNKHIMMITDGKPTCMKRGKEYYKNSIGLDRQIVNRTLSVGARCSKLGIEITTFMVATDPYLIEFIEMFSKTVRGNAFYTQLEGLGEKVFINYQNNRKKFKR